MSQFDFGTIDTGETDGGELAIMLQSWRTAVHSGHKGGSRPSYAIAGTFWVNDTTTPWAMTMFDGTDDTICGYVNATDNMASFYSYGQVITKSADYTVLITDRETVILVDATAGAKTITAPAISAAKNGFKLKVVKSDTSANLVTVARAGSDTINGLTSLSIGQRYNSISMIADSSGVWLATLEVFDLFVIQDFATAVGGSADALTLTFIPPIPAYKTKARIRWTSSGPNTITNPVANVSGIGDRTVKKGSGVALNLGDTGPSGYQCEGVITASDIILLNPYHGVAALGQQTISLPFGAFYPRTTNGAAAGSVETSSNKVMIKSWDFDPTTQEFIQFAVLMPKNWNPSVGLIIQTVWSHAATTTNFGVAWACQAVAFANDDALDTAFGTEVVMVDTGGTTDKLYISPESSAMTVAGSPAAEEWVIFQIKRVPADGGDTMAIDARFMGAKIHYTTKALTDD